MPPRQRNKTAKSSASKRSKASKKSVPYSRTKYAGKYAFKPSGKKSSKMVIRQEGLGQQTANTLRLLPLTKPDTRARYIKAVSASSTYNFNRQYSIISGTTGLQAINATPIAPQSDLRLIADSLQNYLMTGDSTTAGNTPQAPSRFLLEGCYETYDFANRSTAPCTLKLYIIQAKRDTWYSASTPMIFNSTNGFTVDWNGAPDDAMRAGIQASSDPFVSTPGDDNWLNPGMTPTNSSIFNQYFKIEKEMEVELAQGGVHQLTLNSYYDKMCDASVYANTPLVSVRGITRYVLALAVGNPVIVTGTNSMTTSEVEIGVIQTVKYKYTQAWSPVKVAFQDPNNLYQVASNATYQVNPGSGATAQVATA